MNRRGFLKSAGLALVAASPVGAALLECVKPVASVAAPATVPTGTIVQTIAPTVPEGWLVCDGSLISPLEAPALYSALKSLNDFPWGGKKSEIRVPDFRGQFTRQPPQIRAAKDNQLEFLIEPPQAVTFQTFELKTIIKA